MNSIKHLKGNFIVATTGVGLGILSKTYFKKEFIAVSSSGQVINSWFYLLGTTIVGKLIMDKIYEKYWIPYSAGGKNKVENEGFIGPLHGDLLHLISPNRWDNRTNPDRWVPDDGK